MVREDEEFAKECLSRFLEASGVRDGVWRDGRNPSDYELC